MKTNFIDKYFHNHEDYPQDVCGNILPLGTQWSYISTTFLNGFINYVEIKSAWVLNRYQDWDDASHDNLVKVNIMREPNNTGTWEDFIGTKREVYEILIQPGRTFHSKLDNDFKDDMIILSKISDNKWMFFWFDRDCSDSCIGRFETEETNEQVIKDFDEWASTLMMDEYKYDSGEGPKQLPLHYFTGWLKS